MSTFGFPPLPIQGRLRLNLDGTFFDMTRFIRERTDISAEWDTAAGQATATVKLTVPLVEDIYHIDNWHGVYLDAVPQSYDPGGRLFRGLIASVDSDPATPNKIYTIKATDGNVLLDKPPVTFDSPVTITFEGAGHSDAYLVNQILSHCYPVGSPDRVYGDGVNSHYNFVDTPSITFMACTPREALKLVQDYCAANAPEGSEIPAYFVTWRRTDGDTDWAWTLEWYTESEIAEAAIELSDQLLEDATHAHYYGFKRTRRGIQIINRQTAIGTDPLTGEPIIATADDTTSQTYFGRIIAGKPLVNDQWTTLAQVQAAAHAELSKWALTQETLSVGPVFIPYILHAPQKIRFRRVAEGGISTPTPFALARASFGYNSNGTPEFRLDLGTSFPELGERGPGWRGGTNFNTGRSRPADPTWHAVPADDIFANTYHGQVHSSEAILTWVPNSEDNLLDYYVQYEINGGGLIQYPTTVPQSGQPTFGQLGLPPGGTFAVRVRARNTWGYVSENWSPWRTITVASAEEPAAPVLSGYVSHYNGNRISDIVVTFAAGAGGTGTPAYYIFLLTRNGLSRPQRVATGLTTVIWKDAVPGLTYTVTGQAFTQYGDPGVVSPPLSVTAATATHSGWDRDPIPDGLDGDVGAFSRDFTASAVGSGTAPTVDTATVWEGQTAWKLPVGSSAGTSTVTTNYRKAAQPGQVLTYRFREGNAGAAQGTLALFIQPYDKSGAAVGSAVAAYSGAPSTAAAGTVREGQYTLPSTSTITNYGWFLQYTGDGSHARTVYVSGVQVVPTAKNADLTDDAVDGRVLGAGAVDASDKFAPGVVDRLAVSDLAIGPAQILAGAVGWPPNGSMEIPDRTTGTLPDGWTVDAGTVTYSNSLSYGAGDGQYAIEVGNVAGTWQVVSPLMPWTAGHNYSGRVSWREYLSAVSPSLSVAVRVRFYKADYSVISTTGGTLTAENPRVSGAWIDQAAAFDGNITPADTAFIAIVFVVVTASSAYYYAFDALFVTPVSVPSILWQQEHRTGSGEKVGATTMNGNDVQVDLGVGTAWWKLITGAGVDIGSGEYKGATATLTGLASVGRALINGLLQSKIQTLTGATTLDTTRSIVLLDATSAGFNVTLPSAGTLAGAIYWLIRKDASANSVSVVRAGSDTINGATSYALPARYQSVVLVSDGGSGWWVLAEYDPRTIKGLTVNSPLSSTGGTTPTLSLSNQSANQVLAGPTSGLPAAPAFRALVDADFGSSLAPSISSIKLNGVKHSGGSSFPGSPTAGDHHAHSSLYRTGHYDSTRWISEPFVVPWRPYKNSHPPYSATDEVLAWGTPGDYALRLLYWRITRQVNGTHDASNFWTITLRMLDAGGASTTTCASISSWSKTSGGWTRLDPITSFTNQPGVSNGWIEIQLAKTGNPGTLEFFDYLRVVEVLT